MPRPIVIIHGWSDNSRSFGALANYVASISDSLFQINLADYVSMDDEVRYDDLVTAMSRAWKEVGLPTRPGSVDAIVHSTGGLVIRDWLATTYAPGKSPVKRLLMLAPANFGSPLAHKGRAFYGRIVKGFNSRKPFETGTRILKGLELASSYSWNLAMRDRFTKANHFSSGGVLATVLVGNSGYGGIMAAANEDGTDGTVRVSTANLNCASINADFASDPLKPTFNIVNSAGRVAFRILDGDNHSTAAMKDNGPKDRTGRDAIARALTVKDSEFEAWCDECEERNNILTRGAEEKNDEYRFGYQNTVVRVVDDAGVPVRDYFLEFYMDDKDDKRNFFSKLFHHDVIRTVHAYGDDPSYRSLHVDCTNLERGMANNNWRYMKMSLSAVPEFKVNKLVGYRTFSDDDIGAIRLGMAHVKRAFVKHRTVLITITIRRERAPEVFKIKQA